ncbi:twin-arginine translocation signal domain-containing protein [Halomonas sp. HK25]|uniref:twin-arginine translocation signal domain-containing protein n=1 Tax=Halomonas sp. HK25 TaxID=3394321 RepID=UPI0039FC7AFC
MNRSHDAQRRRFLRTLGAGGALAGTATVIGHVSLSQADAPSSPDRESANRNYRETDHIRTYYATLRD